MLLFILAVHMLISAQPNHEEEGVVHKSPTQCASLQKPNAKVPSDVENGSIIDPY